VIAAPDVAVFDADDVTRALGDLGALLHACVMDGASVGLVVPFTPADAEAYWAERIAPALRAGGLVMLVARQAGRIVGTVQLDCATPGNQAHRAELRKLLVHPSARRRGLARALVLEAERHARRLGRSLITLDTRTGDAAEPLYAALGYRTAGVIPGYCRDTLTERLDSTTVMYKTL
jgi:predicted N-acetyltransferase YhbS